MTENPPTVPLELASPARGQRRLADATAAAICRHYGYRPTPGYLDENGMGVYIGSDYVGRGSYRTGLIYLDR